MNQYIEIFSMIPLWAYVAAMVVGVVVSAMLIASAKGPQDIGSGSNKITLLYALIFLVFPSLGTFALYRIDVSLLLAFSICFGLSVICMLIQRSRLRNKLRMLS